MQLLYTLVSFAGPCSFHSSFFVSLFWLITKITCPGTFLKASNLSGRVFPKMHVGPFFGWFGNHVECTNWSPERWENERVSLGVVARGIETEASQQWMVKFHWFPAQKHGWKNRWTTNVVGPPIWSACLKIYAVYVNNTCSKSNKKP